MPFSAFDIVNTAILPKKRVNGNHFIRLNAQEAKWHGTNGPKSFSPKIRNVLVNPSCVTQSRGDSLISLYLFKLFRRIRNE